MKRLAIAIVVIIVALAAAAGALLALPPKGVVNDWIVAQVRAATGQQLKIKGDTSLRLLPRVVLRLEGVELANPPGPPKEPVFAARVVQAEGALWTLLTSREFDQVTIEDGRFALDVDAGGKWNLNIAPGGPGSQAVSVRTLMVSGGSLAYRDARSGADAEMEGLSAEASGLTGAGTQRLALKGRSLTLRGAAGPAAVLTQVAADAKSVSLDNAADVSLKAAAMRYRKDQAGAPIEIAQIEASAKALSPKQPLDADIAFQWDKERLAGKIKLQSLAALIDGAQSPASARLAAPKGQLPFAAAIVEGKVKLDGSRLVVDDATLTLDATKATGALTFDLGGARPLIAGKLAAAEIDADSLIDPKGGTRLRSARGRSAPAPAAPSETAVPVKEALKVFLRAQLAALDTPRPTEFEVSVQDLTAGPVQARAAKLPPWSDDPIDLSALTSVDLDLALSFGKLTLLGFDLGVPDLKAVLKGGMLSLDAKDVAVEGGRVTGTATIDARTALPKMATRFTARGFDVAAVFEAMDERQLIAGKASIEADLQGSGSSQRKLVETLTGRLKAATGDGAIVGYDLSSVWKWIFGSRQYDPKRRTPFDQIEADITLVNGEASKSSVQVKGPVLAATADGKLRLPSREVDYRARLSLASLGQTLALRIYGAWQQLSFAPDWGGFTRSAGEVSSPLEALEAVDLKDPEVARLAGEVLAKAGATNALAPDVMRALEGLKARAEGRE